MEAYGLNEQDLFIDRQSGCDFDRPAYKQMLRKLRPGDQLVIKSIDRLGRNYEEILQQWRLLTKEREVSIVVLDMPVLNSGQTRDLTGTLISDIVLQLLSYVAQTEPLPRRHGACILGGRSLNCLRNLKRFIPFGAVGKSAHAKPVQRWVCRIRPFCVMRGNDKFSYKS